MVFRRTKAGFQRLPSERPPTSAVWAQRVLKHTLRTCFKAGSTGVPAASLPVIYLNFLANTGRDACATHLKRWFGLLGDVSPIVENTHRLAAILLEIGIHLGRIGRVEPVGNQVAHPHLSASNEFQEKQNLLGPCLHRRRRDADRLVS